MRCCNGNCEREIAFDWPCCPHCGAGQEGVSDRVDGSACSHAFVIEGPRCILCGYDPEIGSPRDRAVAIAGTLVLVAVAAALVGHSAYLCFEMPIPSDSMARRGGLAYFVYFVVAALALFWAMGRLFRACKR